MQKNWPLINTVMLNVRMLKKGPQRYNMVAKQKQDTATGKKNSKQIHNLAEYPHFSIFVKHWQDGLNYKWNHCRV